MCYTVQTKIKQEILAAKTKGKEELAARLTRMLETLTSEYYAVSGFAHPKLPVITFEEDFKVSEAHWGLIPIWAKTKKDAFSIWNKTINARGESAAEKPSFRAAVKNTRCVIPVAGFYEYHHHKGNAYPYFVFKKDADIMWLAGLHSQWLDKETGELLDTFTIVTCKGNTMMEKIHNNPKLKEPRIPVILHLDQIEQWLTAPWEHVEQLMQPPKDITLKAHTVQKLKGKASPGNTPEASKKHDYNIEGLKTEY